jgi:hypothetical protein
MKNDLVKKLLPHLIAFLVFLTVSILFCLPALKGDVLEQHDILGWKGMAQNAFDYKEKHGHFPLWNTNVFSGMPNYMIAMEGKSILPNFNAIFGLGLPQPINFFFIACVCFYILCLALRLRSVVAVFGALTFAFATYNPIILNAGHVTKMFAIAYTPLLLAGLIFTFDRKYWLGLAITTLGVFLQVGAGHPQISFYAFIIAAAVSISYLVSWIRSKDWKHIGMAAGISIVAILVGLSGTALGFLTSKEYSKATIRGGGNISINGDSAKLKKTEGLDTAYAFSYSLGKGEAATMLMPNAYGGSTKNTYGEESKIVDRLVARNVPQASAAQYSAAKTRFWGDLDSTAGGPLYAGAITCLLALIGFVLLKHPLRWGLLVVAILGIMMALGNNLLGFNLFLFENAPFYNKFRAPSISMVIPQVVVPIAASLTLGYLLFNENAKEQLQANKKKILWTVGGLIILLGGIYVTQSYSSSFDSQLVGDTGNEEFSRIILAAMKEERKSQYGGQILRTIGFALMLLVTLFLFMKNIIKPVVAAIILTAITLFDQFAVDKKYLEDEKYVPKEDVEMRNFTKSEIDQQLLADTTHFRVFNSGSDRFSASDFRVPAFHKAVGGYHPAKLRIYQDVIEGYLMRSVNPQVLNMLNTKYIILENPQTGKQMLMPNPEAYGPVWFVKNVQVVKDDAEEFMALGKTNLRDTAIIQQSFATGLTQPQWDSAASIRLSKFDNDAIEYQSNSTTPQFAVFSEVFYPYGWNAYLDDKKVDYARTNYILRGLSIPAGKHTIKFVYEPATYKKGVTISYIGSFLIAIFLLGGLFMNWRENKKNKPQPA